MDRRNTVLGESQETFPFDQVLQERVFKDHFFIFRSATHLRGVWLFTTDRVVFPSFKDPLSLPTAIPPSFFQQSYPITSPIFVVKSLFGCLVRSILYSRSNQLILLDLINLIIYSPLIMSPIPHTSSWSFLLLLQGHNFFTQTSKVEILEGSITCYYRPRYNFQTTFYWYIIVTYRIGSDFGFIHRIILIK